MPGVSLAWPALRHKLKKQGHDVYADDIRTTLPSLLHLRAMLHSI
jgi:hypothetical protein